MTRLTILLPPSEGKAVGGSTTPWSPGDGVFGDVLGEHREAIARHLASTGGGDQRLLGVRGGNLDRARRANSTLLGAPTLPAWRRYTGVVWDHLDLESMPAPRRRRAARSIVVVSGLLGLVRGDDPTPDYRLKMGARLDGFGTLSRCWREPLAAALVAHARGRTVIDLLPVEHRAAIETAVSGLRGVRVELRTRGGNAGGHFAKAAKGRLARHLLDADDPIAALATWDDPDFTADVTPL